MGTDSYMWLTQKGSNVLYVVNHWILIILKSLWERDVITKKVNISTVANEWKWYTMSTDVMWKVQPDHLLFPIPFPGRSGTHYSWKASVHKGGVFFSCRPWTRDLWLHVKYADHWAMMLSHHHCYWLSNSKTCLYVLHQRLLRTKIWQTFPNG